MVEEKKVSEGSVPTKELSMKGAEALTDKANSKWNLERVVKLLAILGIFLVFLSSMVLLNISWQETRGDVSERNAII